MNAKVFCFASPKGGSGKTIITANFASFLTVLGKKCLVIDCDSATHGLTLLYLHEVNERKSAHDTKRPSGVFDGTSFTPDRDVIQVENGFDFLPATYTFEILEELNEQKFSVTLQKILEVSRCDYDYIFLDAQAGSDAISRAAMKRELSDEVVIVSEYDPLSAAGIERLKSVVGKDLEFTRTWVLLNKMLPEFVEKFSDFLSVTRYLTPIPWNADVVRSYSRKKLAINTEYGNEYTLAIIQTLKALLGGKVALEIDEWADERASNIRQPLETQYLDSEKELEALFYAKERMQQLRTKSALIRTIGIATFAAVAISFSASKVFEQLLSEVFRTSSLFKIIETAGVSVLSVFAVGLTIIVFNRFIKIKTSEDKLNEARFKRKIEVLEERLKQLEALKKADLKTLVKHGK